MKKSTIKILVMLVLFIYLASCSKNKDPMSEFKRVDGNIDIIDVSYDSKPDGSYVVYIDNLSKNGIFIKTELELNNSNQEIILNETSELIRPEFFAVFTVNDQPNKYLLNNVEYYELNKPVSIDYNHYYNASENYYYSDVYRAGGFKDSDVETVAKQEYTIAVVTHVLDTDYYYYDLELKSDEKASDVLDIENATHFVQVDYEKKLITIFKIENGSDTKIKEVKMPY